MPSWNPAERSCLPDRKAAIGAAPASGPGTASSHADSVIADAQLLGLVVVKRGALVPGADPSGRTITFAGGQRGAPGFRSPVTGIGSSSDLHTASPAWVLCPLCRGLGSS